MEDHGVLGVLGNIALEDFREFKSEMKNLRRYF
jgi:hypothetical protein